jgi:nucleotidyltransferase/DNA polymerase involved in DNA repair
MVLLLNESLHAGVAHTKLMAKLCSGLNKPNMQTVLPVPYVPRLLQDLPLGKLRGLGGKFGHEVQQELCITTAGPHLLLHAHCCTPVLVAEVLASCWQTCLACSCCTSFLLHPCKDTVVLTVFCAGELAQLSVQKLQKTFGEESGSMLFDMARGQDHDEVQPRSVPKSVGCGKNFTAHLQIKSVEKVRTTMFVIGLHCMCESTLVACALSQYCNMLWIPG